MPDEPSTPENDEPSGDAEGEGTSQASSGPIDQSEIDALAAELDGLTDGAAADGSTDPDTREAPSAGSESQADHGTDPENSAAVEPSATESSGTIDPAELDALTAQLNAANEVSGDHVGTAGGIASAEQDTAAPSDGSEKAGQTSNTINQDELDRLTAELKQQTEQGGPATDTTDPEGVAASAPPANSAAADGSDELSTVANELAAEIDATVTAGKGDADDGGDDLAAEMAAVIAAEAAQAVGGGAATSENATPVGASPFEAPDLSADTPEADLASIEMLDDVELDVTIELGRTEMYIEEVLQLGVGSVVQLDKAAGDPVDIYVNARLIARGEVLVLNDNFCVRINDILSPIPELDGDD